MGFSSVRLYNFRNLQDASVDIAAPEVFFVGENGQGKTNFLEAVYLLCYGSSFRTRHEQLLIRNGEDSMAVEGSFFARSDDENDVLVKLEKGRKEIRVNGKALSDRRELLENIPCIVFCHEDIGFVTGSPEMRRIFFNQTLILYDHAFLDTLRGYNRILKARNIALKENRKDLIDVYDLQLTAAGREIVERRNQTVEEFNRTFTDTFREISHIELPLSIRYTPSWKNEWNAEQVISILQKKRYNELSLGVTTSGPHRDRFIFSLGNRDFAQVASTGQLRLISLILRVAQARFYRERTGRKPVLLLDDVLLELDGEKRKRFLSALPEYEQVFFTFLSNEQYNAYRKEKTIVYRVSEGRLVQET